MAVCLLGTNEIGEYLPCLLQGADGDQGTGTLHQVAGPDQMITAPAVTGLAPGHRQARDPGTGKGVVLMDLEHIDGADIEGIELFGNLLAEIAGEGVAAMPLPPRCRVSLLDLPKATDQRSPGIGGCRLLTASEAQGQGPLAGEFARQSDFSWTSAVVSPGHPAMIREILPQITRPHLAHRAAGKAWQPLLVRAEQGRAKGALFRPE